MNSPTSSVITLTLLPWVRSRASGIAPSRRRSRRGGGWRWRSCGCSARGRRVRWRRWRAKVQHTAHHLELEVCYPHHPLFGQTAVVLRKETNNGECHLRVVTKDGQERLLPQWMFESHSFDPSPVEHPVISFTALLDLHLLVLSTLSSLDVRIPEQGQEGSVDDPVALVSTPRGKPKAAPRGATKGSSGARGRLTRRGNRGVPGGGTNAGGAK